MSDSILRFPAERLPQASEAEAAYTALYRRMYDPLRRFAEFELRDADAAEDVVQASFVELWNRYFRNNQTVDQSFDALTFRLVKFRLRDYRRGTRRYREALGLLLSFWAGRAKRWMLPGAAVEHSELAEVIDRAVNDMTPRCREVFVMRREGELPLKRIAELTGVSEETVRSLMNKAQGTLRDHIDRAGFGSGARRRRVTSAGRKR